MSSPRNILTVVGTRPNFIKVTQFDTEFGKYPDQLVHRLCHTGQHYDTNMSDVFFRQLRLRKPDFHLGAEGGSPAGQIGRIITGLDAVFSTWRPDVLLVVGDVNSTLAAAIAGNKAGIPIAHVESGLRSFDRSMPEEINRLLTDEIADLFFVTEESGRQHLLAEGKPEESLRFVGNTMIDTLLAFQPEIQACDVLERLRLHTGGYCLMTMHRPANVDSEAGLLQLLTLMDRIMETADLVFPIHPRTVTRLRSHGLWERLERHPRLRLTDPLDYFSFQKLITAARFVVTDSGGIQEETTFYQVPCLTLRPNTERPVTVDTGTNTLLPMDPALVGSYISQIEAGTYKQGQIPPLWDGRSSQRIAETLLSWPS